MTTSGRVAVVVSIFGLLAASATAAVSSRSAPSDLHAYAFDTGGGAATVDVEARSALTWLGGPVTTSTGEVVNVFVSPSLPLETPEKWAEFLVGLAHGPEISRLTTRIATLAEVQGICGSRALGCYSANEMIAPGEPAPDGTTPEEVVRHEYGHHVGFHRLNVPWRAVDWGPKKWASAAGVCSRVARGEAYPGNGGRYYAQNPGEAWAEVYRLMDERRAGITTASWRIVSPSFFPSDAALAAAERDVLQPWQTSRKVSERRVFGKRTAKTWWIPLSLPLDGELHLSATLPRNGLYEVALVSPNRRTVLKRAQWTGQRVKSTSTTVCGQRSLFVRVTQSGGLGHVTVTATIP